MLKWLLKVPKPFLLHAVEHHAGEEGTQASVVLAVATRPQDKWHRHVSSHALAQRIPKFAHNGALHPFDD